MHVLETARQLAGLTNEQLWVAACGVGLSLTLADLVAVLAETRTVSSVDHDYIAQALNDHFTGRGDNHPVPYAEDLRRDDRG